MPGIDGTLIDETYDLGVLAGDDPYELAWPYVTAFDLAVAPEVFAIITEPTLVFEGLSQPAALISTLDILSWEGLAQPAALVSLERVFLFEGLSQAAELSATVDILTWEGLSQPAALSSEPRD